MHRSSRPVLLGLLGVLALSGCAAAAAPTASPSPAPTASPRDAQVSATFAATPGVAVTYDPALVPVGAQGTVGSTSRGGSTTVTFVVTGLAPDRSYGAHAHTKPCGAVGADAGPHFQFDVDPVQPSVDPAFANPDNEVWLDLTTDPAGAGNASSTVAWELPADRRAHSVVIHAMSTATEAGKAGTAGARLACITVDF